MYTQIGMKEYLKCDGTTDSTHSQLLTTGQYVTIN